MSHFHENQKTTEKNLFVVFLLNTFLSITEFVGGSLTHSLAILASAVHDSGDCVGFGLSWYFEKLSQKERNRKFHFGYKRFSLLAALINCIILFLSSTYILINSFLNYSLTTDIHPEGMILIGIFRLTVNSFSVYHLMKGKSLNEKVIFLHVLEDVLGSLIVIGGSILIYIFHLTFIDIVLSAFLTVLILYNVLCNLLKIIPIFLQMCPSFVNIDILKTEIESLSYVYEVSDIRIWSLDGDSSVFSAHITVSEEAQLEEIQRIKQNIKKFIRSYNCIHETIQIEFLHKTGKDDVLSETN